MLTNVVHQSWGSAVLASLCSSFGQSLKDHCVTDVALLTSMAFHSVRHFQCHEDYGARPSRPVRKGFLARYSHGEEKADESVEQLPMRFVWCILKKRSRIVLRDVSVDSTHKIRGSVGTWKL